MIIKKKIFLLLFGTFFLFGYGQEDKAKHKLTHDVYDDWRTLNRPLISDNGEWIAYEINPFKGDGFLVVYHKKKGRSDTIPRGYRASFSPQSDYIIYRIKAQETLLREARLEKKDELPGDSLGLLNLKTGDSFVKGGFLSYKVPKEESSWVAFLTEKKDTTENGQSSSAKSRIKKGTLHIVNTSENKHHRFDDVSHYEIADNGQIVAFITHYEDTVESRISVNIFNTSRARTINILMKEGEADKLTVDKSGQKVAFLFSADTVASKTYAMYYHKGRQRRAKKIIDSTHKQFDAVYSPSNNGQVYFSEDGAILFFGYGAFPKEEVEDTIPDDEKVVLDLWSWTDERLQSQQLADLEADKKRNYLAAYHTDSQELVKLAHEEMPEVRVFDKGNAPLALGVSDLPYRRSASWLPLYRDIYIVDVKNGDAEKILKQQQFTATLSPSGRYMVYYNKSDSLWYAYNTTKKEHRVLAGDITTAFYNIDDDRPNLPRPYGLAGWVENDSHVLIYDKYNIWKAALDGSHPTVNLTKSAVEGNAINRLIKLDRDAQYFRASEDILIKYTDEDDKHEGFYFLNLKSHEATTVKYKGDCLLTAVRKAPNDSTLIFRRATFREYNDLWVSDLKFEAPRKISHASPQQENYLWGDVELLSWSSEGNDYTGMLYKPENFDSSLAYPMIVYFYERTSHRLHAHYTPNPSRSVINFPLYASQGYLIFVPDIEYSIGYPGKSALDAVMTGVDYLLGYGFVDEDRIGLQGQSWGGYQVAYIITRTNLFRAAMAGAPVSNMTSAYVGIRRTTGINRIHQYEIGQSRIGATLWDRKDLYLENSPLFFADRIETPLLMMHNDNDGAVPWQQGKELFLAMRRLDKPVWLLNYNNDAHNLTREANRRDLSKRMLQFFDHYLKEKPVPLWMKYGISAEEKGLDLKYELAE